MEDLKLINLWNSYDEKFHDSYTLIQKNVQDITQMKVKGFLSSMAPVKIFAVLIGITWIGIVGTTVANLFIFAYSEVSLFFLYSAAVQVLVTAIAVAVYLYQIVSIYAVDLTAPVIETQKTLARLKTSTLWVTRILFLQLPVWTTFYLSQSMFEKGNIILLIFQAVVTTIFLFLALWLFINIRYENRNMRWFKILFQGAEWTPLIKSMELLDQIDDYSFPDSDTPTGMSR